MDFDFGTHADGTPVGSGLVAFLGEYDHLLPLHPNASLFPDHYELGCGRSGIEAGVFADRRKPRKRRQAPSSMLIGLGLCPGAQTDLVREYAERIKAEWHKSTESIFEIARLCAEAKEKLDDDDKKELIERLPFERTRFSKLAKVGEDQRLQNPQILPLLPPHHTILADLTNLSDFELAAAVEAEVIHPRMKRARLTDWVNARRGRPQTETRKPAMAVPKGHLAIRLPPAVDTAQQFVDALSQLCADCGAEILYSEVEIRAEGREQERAYREYRRCFVREARRIVRETKREELKRRPQGVSQNDWPYSPEETRIDDADHEDHIRDVLELIGRPEEFERIRIRAMGAFS